MSSARINAVYRLTSPSGKSYIGITGQEVQERWRQHVVKAIRGFHLRHPLYCAIRKYGADSFIVEELQNRLTRAEALSLEVTLIAAERPRYNLSPGGEHD